MTDDDAKNIFNDLFALPTGINEFLLFMKKPERRRKVPRYDPMHRPGSKGYFLN